MWLIWDPRDDCTIKLPGQSCTILGDMVYIIGMNVTAGMSHTYTSDVSLNIPVVRQDVVSTVLVEFLSHMTSSIFTYTSCMFILRSGVAIFTGRIAVGRFGLT